MTDATALEERIAYLERVADDLSEVVARQDTQIAQLSRRVEMLMMRESEREMEADGAVPVRRAETATLVRRRAAGGAAPGPPEFSAKMKGGRASTFLTGYAGTASGRRRGRERRRIISMMPTFSALKAIPLRKAQR